MLERGRGSKPTINLSSLTMNDSGSYEDNLRRQGVSKQGAPCAFWNTNYLHGEGPKAELLGQEESSKNALIYTGPPKQFVFHEHPMTYYSTFTLGETCIKCSEEISHSGYCCHTCDIYLCWNCSSQEPTHEEDSKPVSAFDQLGPVHRTNAKRLHSPRSPRHSPQQLHEFERPERPSKSSGTMLVPAALSPRNDLAVHSVDHKLQSVQVPIPRRHKEEVKEEVRLNINVIYARNLPVADPNGTSDPYCCVSVFKANDDTQIKELTGCSRTQVIFKSLNPDWNCEFLYPYTDVSKTALKIKFDVWDYDQGWSVSDDYLGSYEFYLDTDSLFDKPQTGELAIRKLLTVTPAGTITFIISLRKGDGENIDPTILHGEKL